MPTSPKRIAIAGGTGLVGRHTAAALESAGHEPVILARSVGVDLVTGEGLDARLEGVDAVIDVLNSTATDPDEMCAFFAATSRTLLAAEQRAGVGHHVLLSIVGLDRVEGNAHMMGKREQERIVSDGPIPFTILRATQFFEFAEMVAGWTTRDGAATVAPLLVQPVAVADVASALTELAAGSAPSYSSFSRSSNDGSVPVVLNQPPSTESQNSSS
jgi:uncharacterized protein YbjT (DUF2867 family)